MSKRDRYLGTTASLLREPRVTDDTVGPGPPPSSHSPAWTHHQPRSGAQRGSEWFLVLDATASVCHTGVGERETPVALPRSHAWPGLCRAGSGGSRHMRVSWKFSAESAALLFSGLRDNRRAAPSTPVSPADCPSSSAVEGPREAGSSRGAGVPHVRPTEARHGLSVARPPGQDSQGGVATLGPGGVARSRPGRGPLGHEVLRPKCRAAPLSLRFLPLKSGEGRPYPVPSPHTAVSGQEPSYACWACARASRLPAAATPASGGRRTGLSLLAWSAPFLGPP